MATAWAKILDEGALDGAPMDFRPMNGTNLITDLADQDENYALRNGGHGWSITGTTQPSFTEEAVTLRYTGDEVIIENTHSAAITISAFSLFIKDHVFPDGELVRISEIDYNGDNSITVDPGSAVIIKQIDVEIKS